MATITFPSGQQGLIAYRKLREFRKRHELEFDPHRGLDKKRRREGIQAQVPNTVADLAAVLFGQEKISSSHQQQHQDEQQKNQEALEKANQRMDDIKSQMRQARLLDSEEAWARYKALRAEKIRLRKHMQKPVPWKALAGKYDPLNLSIPPARRGPGKTRLHPDAPKWTMDGVRIDWADIREADFAQKWPESVTHDVLAKEGQRVRHVHPPPEPWRPSFELQDAEHEEDVSKVPPISESLPEIKPARKSPSEEMSPADREPTWLDRLISRGRDGRPVSSLWRSEGKTA